MIKNLHEIEKLGEAFAGAVVPWMILIFAIIAIFISVATAVATVKLIMKK